MNEAEFLEQLLKLTEANDIPFSEEQGRLCYGHITLMLDWNRRTNLTRITEFPEILIKHLLDSLLPARWLPQQGLALDVGTGAGFPGVPLKILRPQLKMVLLEANHKKVSFLKVLLARLSLKNSWVLHGRWEDFREIHHSLARERYDLITMRAVRLQAEHLTRFASRVLAPGGIFAWWAGPGEKPDVDSFHSVLEAGIEFQGSFPYSLPDTSRPRQLFVWQNHN